MPNNGFNDLCRVCGLAQEVPPWGEDGETPTFNICDCCGVEFGYENATLGAVTKFRDAWIRSGAHWFNQGKKPDHWDLLVELARVGYHPMRLMSVRIVLTHWRDAEAKT